VINLNIAISKHRICYWINYQTNIFFIFYWNWID